MAGVMSLNKPCERPSTDTGGGPYNAARLCRGVRRLFGEPGVNVARRSAERAQPRHDAGVAASWLLETLRGSRRRPTPVPAMRSDVS
jgi:hypothetical protein